jgi:periplasmic divalent cation tolerance protein
MGEAVIWFSPRRIVSWRVNAPQESAPPARKKLRDARRRNATHPMLKTSGKYLLVLVTCGSRREAQRIAREIVTRRLAACVNLFETPVQSVYRWKGKVEKAREFLLLIKTSAGRLAALEAEVKRLHSYDVPEFIALPIVAGSHAYLNWLAECVAPQPNT